ncbi:DUF3892 domain-containing protein [Desulfoluna spongiiphila]|uniref:DUF3892 domain-containing protein n=1 Tax=Desulfoluna spongiiphila TaxID=419481 RepID=UPI00125FC8B6|nr:DUF3892 domain-containing protein [Desulfoluna spongiiphila]
MANNIKGNRDGDNGRNETYTIPGRGVVSRAQLVKEVEAEKHPNFTTYNLNGELYVKAKPDKSESNNVNED